MPDELYMLVPVLIIFAIVFVVIGRNSLKSSGLVGSANRTTVGGDGWSAEMGWRYVRYFENDASVALQIEPMAYKADLVYVPDEAGWLENAPEWVRRRREEILERLRSVEWNRELNWQEGESSFGGATTVPGSLESTFGGQRLEKRRLFHPGGKLTPDEVRELWHNAAQTFAQVAKGEVRIFMDKGIPGSVFQEIELPTLEMNPNVMLVFIKPE